MAMLNQRLTTLFNRYDRVAEPVCFAIRQILPLFFPGSRGLLELLADALGTAQDTWQDNRRLDAPLAATAEQANHLERMLKVVSEDLDELFDRVVALHGRPDASAAAAAAIEGYRKENLQQWLRAEGKLEEIASQLAQVLTTVRGIEIRTLDIQTLLGVLRQQYATGQQQTEKELLELGENVKQLLDRLPEQVKGPVSPSLTQVIPDERQRQLVRDLLRQYHALPPKAQGQVPALVNGLGKLVLGSGDAEAAEAAFVHAASELVEPWAKAEAYYMAYQAALEVAHRAKYQGRHGSTLWEGAFAHLQQAIVHDPQRFSPCPSRYVLEEILGAGGFGVE
ncbi:MAG: hypothetical protein ACFCBW_11860, partial [Candidatus Competibacterales bacterium]